MTYERFAPVGAMLFDHPDPSIFTVLTSPSTKPGSANVDFVIFPAALAGRGTHVPAALVSPEHHERIHGADLWAYDAKPEGFVPGGMSLHNCMLPHGPDAEAFEQASSVELKPVKLDNTLAFMFETRFPQHLTRYAAALCNAATRLRRLLVRSAESASTANTMRTSENETRLAEGRP